MSDCNSSTDSPSLISDALADLGPRTIEGDQGRVSQHSVHDAIAAIEYQRKRKGGGSREMIRRTLLTISNHRLMAHDGRAS